MEAKRSRNRLAVAASEAERGHFAREHPNELLAERRPDAEAAARAAEDAVEQLGAAHAQWITVYGNVSARLRLAGQDTGSMPAFPSTLERLVRDRDFRLVTLGDERDDSPLRRRQARAAEWVYAWQRDSGAVAALADAASCVRTAGCSPRAAPLFTVDSRGR